MINQNTGELKDGSTTTLDLITYLQGHVDMYGDTEVRFLVNGEDHVSVQFEHFPNMLDIDITLDDIEDED